VVHQGAIVDVFLRFSTASKEQLGYDTTMIPILDHRGTLQYDIRVDAPSGPRVFWTKNILASPSVGRVTGRAT
jgi:hypothetical protein